ncbi:class I SAM-dependent methyltransferase [Candidatus Heimdallarchaeota archaeon]|nr:MAG: class I SAM-dependent methyltransferase [Candidatus Heimdallarchaeota archaeon]
MNPLNSSNKNLKNYIEKYCSSLLHAYYDQPIMKALLSNIQGKRVLQIGCKGGGSFCQWLLKQETTLTICDPSSKIIEFTKKQLGDLATTYTADFSGLFPFASDKSFDVIVSSLTLHYISNWLTLFKEIKRIIARGGSIVFSIYHPHTDWNQQKKKNYFKKDQYADPWFIEESPYPPSYYHRTLASMFAIFRRTDFRVETLVEPLPASEAKEYDLETYQKLSKSPHLLFLRLLK